MPTAADSVANLYDHIGAGEVARLQEHPVELQLTLRSIRERLGTNESRRIADVGGGPGAYSFPLADEGHHVDLVDLSPGLIDLAQRHQDERKAAGNKALVQSLSVGNALDKTILNGGAYDAVLLLGPLYHLLDESERVAAVENAMRLAKPKGFVFVAFISVAAHLRDIAMRDPGRLVTDKGFYAKYIQDGRYVRDKEGLGKVQGFHTNLGDIKTFLASHFSGTLDLLELRSQEGILGGCLDAALAKSSPDVIKAWSDLMYEKYSTNEEDFGCADHLLAVLQKK